LSDKSSDGAPGSLFQGFMVGYAYEACRNLYFVQIPRGLSAMHGAEHKERPTGDRAELLQWINTYLNLVSELSLTGVDALTKDLGQMAKDVTPARRGDKKGAVEGPVAAAIARTAGPVMATQDPSALDPAPVAAPAPPSPHPTVTTTTTMMTTTATAGMSASMPGTAVPQPTSPPSGSPPIQSRSAAATAAHTAPDIESFDAEFDEVLGAIRAKVPYAYYAVLFGEYCSRLRHPRDEDSRSRSAKYLDGCLSEMRNALPGGAYEVIHYDLEKYAVSSRKGRRAQGEKEEEGRGREGGAKEIDELRQRIQTWADLICGTSTPRSILTLLGSSLLYGSVALAGILVSLLVAAVIIAVFTGVAHIPGIDLTGLSMYTGQNLISSAQTVTTTLAAAGLSLTLLATKAWAWLQAFERETTYSLAKRVRLRKSVDTFDEQ
jgi:hypothetical protein